MASFADLVDEMVPELRELQAAYERKIRACEARRRKLSGPGKGHPGRPILLAPDFFVGELALLFNTGTGILFDDIKKTFRL